MNKKASVKYYPGDIERSVVSIEKISNIGFKVNYGIVAELKNS